IKIVKIPITEFTHHTSTALYYTLYKHNQDILKLLLSGHSNKAIAARLKIPISTIQRRTTKLFERGFLRVNYELNYRKLGLRKGLLHVYLKDGNLEGIADQIARINGIQST